MIIDGTWLAMLIAMSAMGFIGNSYQYMARAYGWPVGELFDGGGLAAASIIIVPLAVGAAWYSYGWMFGGIVLLLGFFAAFALTIILRDRVQYVWATAFLLAVIYIGYRTIEKII